MEVKRERRGETKTGGGKRNMKTIYEKGEEEEEEDDPARK